MRGILRRGVFAQAKTDEIRLNTPIEAIVADRQSGRCLRTARSNLAGRDFRGTGLAYFSEDERRQQ